MLEFGNMSDRWTPSKIMHKKVVESLVIRVWNWAERSDLVTQTAPLTLYPNRKAPSVNTWVTPEAAQVSTWQLAFPG